MAKTVIPYTHPTDEEIFLLQPNNVTFGQYSLTPVQENILTLIMEAIQKHMSREQELPRDLFHQPYIEIFCDEAGGENNKNQVIEQALKLMDKPFSFKWKHPAMGKEIETKGTIINTIHNIKKTNKIAINFNVWAVPFLIYYGTNVGGTWFNKTLALTLPSNYTKRIYKIICSQRDRTEYHYNLDQFRIDFEIPASYDNGKIDYYILKPASERIKESKSDVWFDYEMICKNPTKGRKPKSDTIVFNIKSKTPQQSPQTSDQFQQFTIVYSSIALCFDPLKTDKTRVYTDKLTALGELSKVAARCEYWIQQVKDGKMPQAKMINSIKKMLREDYGMD